MTGFTPSLTKELSNIYGEPGATANPNGMGVLLGMKLLTKFTG